MLHYLRSQMSAEQRYLHGISRTKYELAGYVRSAVRGA
jgi:hypothetical protein